METDDPVRERFCVQSSPTRLEGMETWATEFKPIKKSWSPTRLEGMETWVKENIVGDEGSLRPALRGWKPAQTAQETGRTD